MKACFIVLAALSVMNPCAWADSLRVPATEPDKAEATIKALDGFQMKLIAAEPLLTDPVAMVYDENGVAYVAEMNDYPYTDKKNDVAWQDNVLDPAIGKIRMLVDEDGDGKFDKSYVFAEGLSWPTGIAPYKGGIFVAATPDIWYLKDTDGDHKADVRVKVYTGFRKYNVQAVMNNLIWGLDHKIYGAGSGNGGTITNLANAEAKPLVLNRNDFRFDPETKGMEPLPGGQRFGNSFDDWGNRFLCNIRNPAIHIVLPSYYLVRNPYLAVHTAIHDATPSGDNLPVYRMSPSEPWRVVRAERWVNETNHKYPRSELVPDGYFTSASGITIYRGAAYPKEFYGNVFLGEVAGNLVHRELLAPDGVTFKAQRAEQKTEFIRSTDNWFRPVNFVNAPDGTLHVLDMYRETIEHPWSIPDDIKAQLDLTSGRDRGRIYRLEPPNFKVPKPPHLGSVSTAELVKTLDNPNSWWRDTAHRLIYERQDEAAVKPLRKLLRSSKFELARLHALYSLQGLNALTDDDILAGLADKSAGVREHAVRFAEPRLKSSPKLLSKVLEAADDREVRVRFQTAFTLGEVDEPKASDALFKITKRDVADEWVQAAVLSSAVPHGKALLQKALKDETFGTIEGGRGFIRQLAFMAGVKNDAAEVKGILAGIGDEHVSLRARQSVVQGLGDGLRKSGRSLSTVVDSSSPVAKVVADLLSESRKVALDNKAPMVERKEAIQFLSQDKLDDALKILTELLKASQPREIQVTAIGTLKGFTGKEAGKALIDGWSGYTPLIRNEVIEAMLARFERLPLLLDAVEQGKIAPGFIPQARKTMLINHSNPSINQRAKKLFAGSAPGSRGEVMQKYQVALTLKGSAEHGHQIYLANCVTCHRSGKEGFDVGPNLATIHDWTPDQVLLNVLDPNREISPNYVNYNVLLKNGETVSGLIAEETPTSINLKRANNVQETILRQNIESISSSGISLMPEGLETAISPQDMADLMAFLLGR
jgi:putative membrane-bound dehydrogenase-like protein